jgi:hypothetical protein
MEYNMYEDRNYVIFSVSTIGNSIIDLLNDAIEEILNSKLTKILEK